MIAAFGPSRRCLFKHCLGVGLLAAWTATCVLEAQAQHAVQVFPANHVVPSSNGTSLTDPVTFGSAKVELSCPASGISAVVSSTADGTGNVLVDNVLDLAVGAGSNPAGEGVNLCGPKLASGRPSSCVNLLYAGAAEQGQLDGQDPDGALAAKYGVSAIDIGSRLFAGSNTLTFSLVDTGGYRASSSIYIQTNCKPAVKSGGTQVPVETCSATNEKEEHILPPGSADTPADLQISGVKCIVDGQAPSGNYVYRNVNIFGGGTLHFEDAKINFHAHSILVESGGTLEAGMDAPVNGPLSIWLYGAKGDGIPSITCLSGPTCGVPQNIWNSNPNVAMQPMLMPTAPCTPAPTWDPSTPVGSDCFYQYEIFDKGDAAGAFFGTKVLAVSYGGILYLRGEKGIRDAEATGKAIGFDPSDSGTSWVRLTDTIPTSGKGTLSFHVDRPVPTWQGGDQIVVTSTDYLPGHSEELTIDHVSSDTNGTLITVKSPGFQFPHWGETYNYTSIASGTGPRVDLNGPPLPPSPPGEQLRQLETRAAVALLTRSILIQSEGATPLLKDRNTDPTTWDPSVGDPHFPLTAGYNGGHTVVRQGFAQYQVQGVEFANLGQGGLIGNYPVHFHMDRKVPQPTTLPLFAGTYLADSSIHDSNTRFVTIHATQGLLVSRNVGYRSIGHGYYLEDATEINNKLYSNIGIQALAAVYSNQNPRNVPGILSQTGRSEAEVVPFHSDFDHPSIFWIMNTWNDFQYNVAVGAGTCGVCYWMPPASNSGYSVYETWDSYAQMQKSPSADNTVPATLAGAVPLFNFVGNSCSAAMTALQTTGNSAPCNGVTSSDVVADGKLQAVPNPTPTPAAAYPNITDLRAKATACDKPGEDCSNSAIVCTGDGTGEANCVPTVIRHFTTSFNWAQLNFASVLLRGWWYLLEDSAITDVQNGGLQMVTGGGYTRSDIAQGFWNLSLHNLFVGNTQPIIPGSKDGGVPENPFASNAGPFNPYALLCPRNPNGGLFCISKDQGIAFENTAFSDSQRLLNIYDGPTFEDSDAFSDIHTLNLGTLSDCRNGGNSNNPGDCGEKNTWMNAYISGVLQSPEGNLGSNNCILPNAAISWKQPNGFYYPPAFNSRNLFFNTDSNGGRGVDIRHFVIDPLWQPGGFVPNTTAVMKAYCSWQPGDFGNFTDVDRQTELTDLDGSLTGLLSKTSAGNEPTISVNNDPLSDPKSPLYDSATSSNFFNAPVITPECESSVAEATATVNTSPYEYATTAIFPACIANGSCGNNWGQVCTSQSCYGVPLYRQYLTPTEMAAWDADHTKYPSIRMMGQKGGQRSNLTMNHGGYYIDTTVPASLQPPPPPQGNPNVFAAGQTYYVYLLYATTSLHQTYSMYIGKDLSVVDGEASVKTGVVKPFAGTTPTFMPGTINGSPDWITKKYFPDTGILQVTIDLTGQTDVFDTDRPKFCQPTTYCTASGGSCGCKDGTSCMPADNVCSWGTKDIDCPVAGCFGFAVTLPATFELGTAPLPPPDPVLFTAADPDYFGPGNVKFASASQSVAGSCYYNVPPTGEAARRQPVPAGRQ